MLYILFYILILLFAAFMVIYTAAVTLGRVACFIRAHYSAQLGIELLVGAITILAILLLVTG